MFILSKLFEKLNSRETRITFSRVSYFSYDLSHLKGFAVEVEHCQLLSNMNMMGS